MTTIQIIEALNLLGYNKETAEKRIWIGKNISEGSTAYHRKRYGEDIDIVLTGSRREGVGATFDTDIDQMFVDNAVLCVEPEEVESCKDINKYRAVLLLDTQTTPAGYAFLKLFRLNIDGAEIPIEIKYALTLHNGSTIVRNDKVRLKAVAPLLGNEQQNSEDGWMKKTFELNIERKGPSTSYALKVPYLNGKLYYDDCLAFQCRVPSFLKSWVSRKRDFDWPGKNLISMIEKMPGHVVPVGIRGHREQFLQWRICFTRAETALVESFNDTQIKVYVVLKNLTKPVFKKICDGLTSYTMKNILFWISEEVPMAEFQTKDFAARLCHAVLYLKKCIEGCHLPSYMIEKRNLLAGKVTNLQQRQLMQIIENMLTEGPSVALRIPEVLEIIDTSNEEVRRRKIKRREMGEQALLAPFALPPAETADVLRLFLDAPTPGHLLKVYMKRVIPYIRSKNPQGFFTHIVSDDLNVVQYISEYAKL